MRIIRLVPGGKVLDQPCTVKVVQHQPDPMWLQDGFEFRIPAGTAQLFQLFPASGYFKTPFAPGFIDRVGRSIGGNQRAE